ncbi:MAG: AraC family ligand binding domain-containing protein [Candidatus Cryptobacteroides sp.]
MGAYNGEWHSYSPDPKTGWSEYWIGFNGANIDHRVEAGFFSVERPVYRTGYNETVIELYREAIRTARRQVCHRRNSASAEHDILSCSS